MISRAVFFGSDKEIVLDPQLQRVQLQRRSERDTRRLRFSIAYVFRKKVVHFCAPDAATYETWYAWLQFALRRFELRLAKRGRIIGEVGGKCPVAATERTSCASTVDNEDLRGSSISSGCQDDVQFGSVPKPAVSQPALADKICRRDLLLLYALSDSALIARRRPHCVSTLAGICGD
ncbi:hypothetical protein BBJ28_00004937 [Nothophytophthora sp. Chile5]|nr:hypothetical protein BBJ28_00004937 [Nothophytophthora sp. Chile5]